MKAIDHLNDPMMTTFVKLAEAYAVPDFVRHALPDELSAPDTINSHSYALPSKQALPLNTKAATWLSAMYFDNCQEGYSEFEIKQARSRIRDAMGIFQLQWPERREVVDEVPAEAYLIEKQGRGLLPVRNAAEAMVAKAYLLEHAASFDTPSLKQASSRLLDRFSEMNLTMPDKDCYPLELAAGRFTLIADDVAKAATARARIANLYGMSDDADKFFKLAKDIGDFDSLLPEDLSTSVTSVFEKFDATPTGKTAGCKPVNKYPRSFISKWAANTSIVLAGTGEVYRANDLAKLPAAVLGEIEKSAGVKLSDSLGLFLDPAKVTEAADNFNRWQSKKAAALLKRAGVQPVVKVGGNELLSEQDWATLASE